jgi:flagellar biosynthesis/type III secretory pathway protein FliH
MDSHLKISAKDWDSLCWYGSVYGQAAKVMSACENAVALAPEKGGILDSRALARALTGNIQGAIEDYQFAIKQASRSRKWKQKRQGWLDALKKGENPFTEEVLKGLR